jgi:murein DD-endopeptidase MepM/ murein hydrolase activator NlpD
MPALADDPVAEALKRKQELERAVQISRANAERYKQVASQFQAAVGEANARIADLAQQEAAAQSEADALAIQIRIREEQLQLVAFQLNETNLLVDSLKAQSQQEARLLAQREEIYAKHLRTTYRQARISPLEMLLSSASLSEFASRIQAMVLINRQDAQLAHDIRALRAETGRKQESMAAKELEILGLKEQITRQRTALADDKARYDALVDQAQGSIATQAVLRAGAANNATAARTNMSAAQRETANLNSQLAIAEARYVELAAAAAGRSGLSVFNGRVLNTWPLRGPITSGFGPRWGGFHNGMDIAQPLFTPIVAAAPGIVTTVGRPYIASGDTAVVVIIAHGSNLSTLYGHLNDSRWPPVSVGQRVNAGQIVGYIGMTGWTTGPHLHFMTIQDGRAVNPANWLP